jgi:hypothetical protein
MPGPSTQQEASNKEGDYQTVAADIVKILKKPDYDDGSIGPILVRCASSPSPLSIPPPRLSLTRRLSNQSRLARFRNLRP